MFMLVVNLLTFKGLPFRVGRGKENEGIYSVQTIRKMNGKLEQKGTAPKRNPKPSETIRTQPELTEVRSFFATAPRPSSTCRAGNPMKADQLPNYQSTSCTGGVVPAANSTPGR